MQVKNLEEALSKVPPEMEIYWKLITADDIRTIAYEQGFPNPTDKDIKAVMEALNDRNDSTDTIIEYYLDLLQKGELEE